MELITTQEDMKWVHKEVCGGFLKLVYDQFSFYGGQIFMGYAMKAYWRGYKRGYEQHQKETNEQIAQMDRDLKDNLETSANLIALESKKVKDLQDEIKKKKGEPPTFDPAYLKQLAAGRKATLDKVGA